MITYGIWHTEYRVMMSRRVTYPDFTETKNNEKIHKFLENFVCDSDSVRELSTLRL